MTDDAATPTTQLHAITVEQHDPITCPSCQFLDGIIGEVRTEARAAALRETAGLDVDGLGAAWRRCEAALPEGNQLGVMNGVPNHYAWAYDGGESPIEGHGSTPALALEALAEALTGR